MNHNWLNPRLLRWDRYENKQLNWIEEELEAEWAKTTARSRRSETEYQTSVGASAAFESSLAGLSMAPDGVGPEGQSCKTNEKFSV